MKIFFFSIVIFLCINYYMPKSPSQDRPLPLRRPRQNLLLPPHQCRTLGCMRLNLSVFRAFLICIFAPLRGWCPRWSPSSPNGRAGPAPSYVSHMDSSTHFSCYLYCDILVCYHVSNFPQRSDKILHLT